MVWSSELETAFHPSVVAMVGVPSNARRNAPWALGGAAFIRAYEQLGFSGRIYRVNPGTTEILATKPIRQFPLSRNPRSGDYCSAG